MSESKVGQSARITGGCQCGAVRYAISAALEDLNVCHCRMCQKAGGGPFLAFCNIARSALTFTRGKPALYASSTLAERGFCKDCGTPLTYQRKPDAIGITTGSLDRAEQAVPTSRLARDTVLEWSEQVGRLPITDIAEWRSSAGIQSFRIHQHPDRDDS